MVILSFLLVVSSDSFSEGDTHDEINPDIIVDLQYTSAPDSDTSTPTTADQ